MSGFYERKTEGLEEGGIPWGEMIMHIQLEWRKV